MANANRNIPSQKKADWDVFIVTRDSITKVPTDIITRDDEKWSERSSINGPYPAPSF